jgi:hypothetical protein
MRNILIIREMLYMKLFEALTEAIKRVAVANSVESVVTSAEGLSKNIRQKQIVKKGSKNGSIMMKDGKYYEVRRIVR